MGKKTEKRIKSLEKVIEQWVQDNCEDWDNVWIKWFWGNKSTKLMARAAIAVLEAIDEVQEYAVKEGFLSSE